MNIKKNYAGIKWGNLKDDEKKSICYLTHIPLMV